MLDISTWLPSMASRSSLARVANASDSCPIPIRQEIAWSKDAAQYDALLTSAGALTITRDPATGFVTSSTLGSTTETRGYNSYGEEQSYTVKFGSTVLYSVAPSGVYSSPTMFIPLAAA